MIKLPKYVRRGTVEIARAPGSRGGAPHYQKMPAYLVGAIAVHKSVVVCGDWTWHLTHTATGLAATGSIGMTLTTACALARAIDGAIDWAKIKRGKNIGSVVGMTERKGMRVRHAYRIFWREYQRKMDAA